MKEIQQFFNNIGKGNIDENTDNLVENGILDSIGIMNLVQEIESFYNISIDFDYITQENFKNFKNIKKMISEVLNEQ